MTLRALALAGLLLVVAAACAGGTSPGPSSTPGPSASPGTSPGPSSTPGAPATTAELKVVLIDRFGALWYCDPDFYPIAREDEQQRAIERFGEVQADTEAFAAALAHLGLDAGGAFTDAEKLAIYRAWQVINAIGLDPIGSGSYRFDYLAEPQGGSGNGTRTAGIIDSAGAIEIEQQAPAGEPMCPICLARGAAVDTPAGPVAVESLRIGDPVWTLDRGGNRVAGVVIAIGSTTAPAGHEVVRLILADGRTVTASPGHPLADGRRLGELRAGDVVDGSIVASAVRLPYDGGETFDIAVSGPTGLYLVDAVALESTLD